MSDSAERELAIFSDARRLPVAERAAFLDHDCAGNSAFRQSIEELLKT
jgi:hypothetical protein